MKLILALVLSITAITAQAGTWKKSTYADKMDGSVTTLWSIDSDNKIKFQFPYGTTQGFFAINEFKDGQTIVIGVGSGQFTCPSYGGCLIRVKADDAPIEYIQAYGDGNGRSNRILVMNDEARKLRNMIGNARSFKVEAEFYREGLEVLSFSKR